MRAKAFLRHAMQLCLPLLGSSCVGLVANKQTYVQSSGPHRLNGSELKLQVQPEGTENGSYAISAMVVSTAIANLDGPFRWRLVATGIPGQHGTIQIHRLTTTTRKSARREEFPPGKLGSLVRFQPCGKDALHSRAVFSLPGLLQVKPARDGELTVEADLSISRSGMTRRASIAFKLTPARKSQREWIFIPSEIIQNAGKPLEDTDERSWD